MRNHSLEVLNDEAWGAVVAAYGMKPGQVQIERYARNTAGPDAAHSNIMYEVYPPVFTIRKVPQPKQQDEEEEKQPTTKHSMDKLRLRQEQQGRGQNSPDDAIKLVSSRHEKFQKFLSRSKEAAGIQRATKVKIFKLVETKKNLRFLVAEPRILRTGTTKATKQTILTQNWNNCPNRRGKNAGWSLPTMTLASVTVSGPPRR